MNYLLALTRDWPLGCLFCVLQLLHWNLLTHGSALLTSDNCFSVSFKWTETLFEIMHKVHFQLLNIFPDIWAILCKWNYCECYELKFKCFHSKNLYNFLYFLLQLYSLFSSDLNEIKLNIFIKKNKIDKYPRINILILI